jgi:hypothetical protein
VADGKSVDVRRVKRDVAFLREASVCACLHECTPPIVKLRFDGDETTKYLVSAANLSKAASATLRRVTKVLEAA